MRDKIMPFWLYCFLVLVTCFCGAYSICYIADRAIAYENKVNQEGN